MRHEPLRIEPFLTRDYINHAVKMREIEEASRKPKRASLARTLFWVILVSLGLWGIIGWGFMTVWGMLCPS